MQAASKKRSSEKQPTTDELLAAIAKQTLHISTLETRNSDSLDFYHVSVWSIKDALEAAYRAGLAAARGSDRAASSCDGPEYKRRSARTMSP